jgi:Raf kinase inhibitor-like YbhB/YbcL family protein
MKTLLLILAMGFAATSVNAQTNSCSIKKKTTCHSTYIKKQSETPATVIAKNITVQSCPANYVYIRKEPLVKDCPAGFDNSNGCIYDSTGNVKFVLESTWAGYYPEPAASLMPRYSDMIVSSPAFDDYGVIPAKYSCEGETASPPLSISNIPAGTQSLAVIVTDPKANEGGEETYWMVWDIDTTGFIPENFISDHMALNAAKEYGYHGVCPKSGAHYYHFTVYALDTKLRASKNVNKITLQRAMRGHVLSKGDLVGVYDRHLD